ncbi:MAG: AAA family ATPase [Treponema sp.]|nr:AAA family ATPase [Treponema sp.]
MEECQTLYKALVSALSLEKHAAKVIDAFIQRHVRDKKLTPLCDSSESRHIFDFRGELSKAYKEDAAVYDKCGSWSSSSEQDVSSLAVRLLSGSGGMSLLLYGAAGAGKTEYARSLARTAGLTPLVFKNELELDGDDNKSGNNALCRLNCILSLPRKDSVIIVDEAETVLKTRGSFLGMGFSLPQKGTVNQIFHNPSSSSSVIAQSSEKLTFALPFRNPSGQRLETAVLGISSSNESCWLMNLVNCITYFILLSGSSSINLTASFFKERASILNTS